MIQFLVGYIPPNSNHPRGKANRPFRNRLTSLQSWACQPCKQTRLIMAAPVVNLLDDDTDLIFGQREENNMVLPQRLLGDGGG